MRKHAIVTICVMLSFYLRANFLPEISGGARGEAGGTGSPLFWDQTGARRAEKSLLRPPGPPLSRGLYDRAPLHLSEVLDPPLEIITQFSYLRIETTFTHWNCFLSSVVREMSPRSSPEQTLALLGKAQESGWNGADKMMRPFFSTPAPQAMSYICD